jgi:hypothetical protein
MSKKTFQGSCQCGRVKFEVALDLSKGTGKCNCRSCWKRRWWSVRAEPADFRSIAGASELSGYREGQETGHSGFCKHCGVTPYSWIPKAEWNEAEYVSVNVACLDDLPTEELLAAPVQFMDGRNDNWWSVPAETRHL